MSGTNSIHILGPYSTTLSITPKDDGTVTVTITKGKATTQFVCSAEKYIAAHKEVFGLEKPAEPDGPKTTMTY